MCVYFYIVPVDDDDDDNDNDNDINDIVCNHLKRRPSPSLPSGEG